MKQDGLKWPESIEIAIWNHLQWISASLAVILSGHMTSLQQFWVWGQNWLKVAKNGQKRPQMTEIRLNVWIMTSETIFIGFLLLLQSFWVVTWPVKDNFEFWAKIGQKWPKKAPNDQKWPECLKSDIRNHLHWISASLAVILSGHMTGLRQFWIWGQN